MRRSKAINDSSLGGKLVASLRRMDERTREEIFRGFFIENQKAARMLVLYWQRSGIDASSKDLERLMDILEDESEKQKGSEREQEIERFVTEASKFKEDAFNCLYLRKADFEDKRRAYHEGTVISKNSASSSLGTMTVSLSSRTLRPAPIRNGNLETFRSQSQSTRT
jgi:hypothetical protein